MNFDGESRDLEGLIHIRSLTYVEAILTTWTEKWSITMESDLFSNLCYEARQIFKEE